jgi:hypothetical protein
MKYKYLYKNMEEEIQKNLHTTVEVILHKTNH